MKKVYFSHSNITGQYFFSEYPLNKIEHRKEFKDYDSLISFLECSDIDPLRKRNNLQMILSGFDNSSLDRIKGDIHARKFKSNNFVEE